MPVTPKQLEQMRQLEREHRDKQDTFIRKWHEDQRRMKEPAKPDLDETQRAAKIDSDKAATE